MTGLGSGVRSVSAGGEHTCAVKLDNTAYCWGDDDNGQLGDGGANTDSNVPVALGGALAPANANVASIDAGFDHTCAVTTANVAYCSGDDDKGQIGNGGPISRRRLPRPTVALALARRGLDQRAAASSPAP